MKLKTLLETPREGWMFQYISKADGVTIVTVKGGNFPDLRTKVTSSLNKNGWPIPDTLGLLIQHQICLRQPSPEESCWNSGIGDKIHFQFVKRLMRRTADKADLIASQPNASKLVKKAMKVVSESATAIGHCKGCSGSKTYNPNSKLPMGRAGLLNRIGKLIGR